MRKQQIRTLVVEDHTDCRDRIVAAVRSDPAMALTGVQPCGPAALRSFLTDGPDILIIGLPARAFDPIPLVRLAVSRSHPATRVLLLTHQTNDPRIIPALLAGAGGCLLWIDKSDRIRLAIRALHAGEPPLSQEIYRSLLRALQPTSTFAPTREAPGLPRKIEVETGLTSREVEILRLICKGLPIASMASVCQISCHTVVTHLKSIYRKLRVHSRGEAVFEARQLGLK